MTLTRLYLYSTFAEKLLTNFKLLTNLPVYDEKNTKLFSLPSELVNCNLSEVISSIVFVKRGNNFLSTHN